MTRSLKIALLHLAPRLGARDENRALIESGTRIVACLGADWVLSGERARPSRTRFGSTFVREVRELQRREPTLAYSE
jgi:hypothetical protein